MWSNCMVFRTYGGISSSPAAFLFLIFLSTESISSWVNGPSLMSNCFFIIHEIGSCVPFGGCPSKFSKCCFHRCVRSCWLIVFSLALAVLFFLLTSFIVFHAILACLSSNESLFLSIWFCIYSVCSFRYMSVTANRLKSQNGTLFSHVWRRGRLALDPLQNKSCSEFFSQAYKNWHDTWGNNLGPDWPPLAKGFQISHYHTPTRPLNFFPLDNRRVWAYRF